MNLLKVGHGTVVVLLSAAACFLHGQVQATNGRIQGDVVDSQGSAVPDAQVEALQVETNTSRNSVTDKSGHFEFPSLLPGHYTVKITKAGFATTIQQNLTLTVGLTTTLKLVLQVAGTTETVTVTDVPQIDVTTVSAATTLSDITIATSPVLGRKFEDLLTLTPGVSIVQGPDGDEININGQRGIFNNISLDGGDYNNGFFGEQSGGQRAAVDITLEAVREFQIVSSGANAEFGRTGGGVVNVITKSGTNDFHGSLFEYQRLEALAAAASDGTPLTDFHREQFGGSAGGQIVKNKLFYFGAAEGITENLQRANLSKYNAKALHSSPCPVTDPVFSTDPSTGNITEAQISGNGDCQRLVLINFFKSSYSQDESTPIDHTVRNGAFFGRGDYNITPKHLLYASYNFDYSRNPNQTFDVVTYGPSANGIEGPAHIQTLNGNLNSTFNERRLNEAHITYGHETRPRSAINPKSVPDTGIGFVPSFRFGQPFFLGPGASEVFYHLDFKDNFTSIVGRHTLKFGGEYLFSHNTQVFDGFALGRYIFGDVVGFLHYATPFTAGDGYGPNTVFCSTDGMYHSKRHDHSETFCPDDEPGASPLFLYLQDAPVREGQTVQQAGYSSISNHEPAAYFQDTWQVNDRLTLNYGLRWEAQFFPDPVIPPAQTLYGQYLSDPAFPSTGRLPNQKAEFQPRLGFNYNIFGNGKSVLRASGGIFYARQNMLTQVGPITTNGVQQQTLTQFTLLGNPTYPGVLDVPPCPTTGCPGAGVTVFDRHYHNPRIYQYDVGFDQQVGADYVAFVDFNDSKGVWLTRFLQPNIGSTVTLPENGDTVTYSGDIPFPNLGPITNTVSNAKSLYRGLTFGVRKRMTHHYQFEAQYTWSDDRDDDSNERDPFTFRYANFYNLKAEYSLSDRDETHKFNAFGLGDLPLGIQLNTRIQSHSAEPQTDNVFSDGTGAPCSFNNSATRFVDGVDCGRNHLRKDNAFFTTDFGFARPFTFHDNKLSLVPKVEIFNTFNNKNNLNPLSSPALFDFNGFLRVGVGDPRQLQLSLRFAW
jgi:hypothetical protein